MILFKLTKIPNKLSTWDNGIDNSIINANIHEHLSKSYILKKIDLNRFFFV